jgi:hypothetical protein
MSTKTRREKRKAAAVQPVETDWLWSCPPGMPLGEIARWLGFESEPHTELSAHSWADERRMRDDLYRALVPNIALDRLAPHVVWGALAEYVLTACLDGRLIVLRDLPDEVPHAVQMLIDIVGGRDPGVHSVESRPGVRFALVLDSWTAGQRRRHACGPPL